MKIQGSAIIPVLIMALLLQSKAVCQVRIGIVAGPALNFLDSRKFNSPTNVSSSRYGYRAGISVQYDFRNRISILSGLDVIQKNYSLHRPDSIGTQFSFRNTFIQAPLLLQWKVLDAKRLSLYVSGGGFVSYWKSGRVNAQVPNTFDSYVDDKQSVHVNWEQVNTTYEFTTADIRYEYGLVAGLTLGYEMTSRIIISTSLQFYRSLANLRIDQSPARFNNTGALGLGLTYNIKDK